jgi:hypothetical protein
VLSRNKRFLVFNPNGGTAKFVGGYLGPIDTPEIMKEMRGVINCLRNIQYQFGLPLSWYTKFPHFPGLTRSQGRQFSDDETKSQVKHKPDSTRKIAYDVVEEMLKK